MSSGPDDSQCLRLPQFELQRGVTLAEATLVYATLGELNQARSSESDG